MLLQHAFESTRRRLPDKVAIVCGAERLTYAQLGQRVDALSALLRARRVAAGDRIVLYLDPGSEFAVAIHAVLSVGAVFVPISALTKPEKLTYVLNDTRATVLLTNGRLASKWTRALPNCTSAPICVVCGLEQPDPRVEQWPEDTTANPHSDDPADQDPASLAAIIYTSGTTGSPKGVMLSHKNMCSAWRSVQAYLNFHESDIIGLALPPSFSYGLYHVLIGLGIGATVMIERSTSFPVKLVEAFARERITIFPGVPTLFSAILGIARLEAYDLSSLRIITSAAAALPEGHVERIRQRFPQAKFYSMYGMTECKRISYLEPEELSKRPSSVGRGMPFQDLWLANDEGERLPFGSTGELVVCGDHVMLGYWEKPDETAARLRLDPSTQTMVLHTGDIFRTDAEGYLYFVGRRDDIIKSAGEKVSPREVENAIYSMDGVQECAVIGVADPLLGEAVKAYVVAREGVDLTARDVIRHCLSKMESYMAPKSVVFLNDLPRTDSGKIRKLDLR